jgi:hypothetical protein
MTSGSTTLQVRLPRALRDDASSEAVPVDRATQLRLDRIAKAWKKTKSRR